MTSPNLTHGLNMSDINKLLNQRINDNKGGAKPITPPFSTENNGSYRCIVDYGRMPFEVTWRGQQQYPDLSRFPCLDKGVVQSVIERSPMISAIWKASALVDFGSYASTRYDKSRAQFPIIKLAHPDNQSLRFIQHEFSLLSDLLALPDLPVVRIEKDPILDGDVLCGFRMEELFKVPIPEFHSRKKSIEDALKQLHAAGFSHGDVQPSNIMKDKTGRIVLIDFGFSGRIGDEIPSFFPKYVYQNSSTFIEKADVSSLARFQA